MKSKTGWIVAIVLGMVILFMLPSLLMGRFSYGGYNGIMGPGMMGGFGYTNPLGFFAMTLIWLIPIGALTLLVTSTVALVNSLIRPRSSIPAVSERECLNCGKPAQTDWAACPTAGKRCNKR